MFFLNLSDMGKITNATKLLLHLWFYAEEKGRGGGCIAMSSGIWVRIGHLCSGVTVATPLLPGTSGPMRDWYLEGSTTLTLVSSAVCVCVASDSRIMEERCDYSTQIFFTSCGKDVMYPKILHLDFFWIFNLYIKCNRHTNVMGVIQ